MRYVASLLFLMLLGGPVHAQDFVVEQSAPAPGNTDVSLSDTIAFSFNREISVSTDWNTKFVYEPSDSLQLNAVSLCLNFQSECGGGNDVPRHVRFRVDHEPDADYTWLIYDVRSAEGDPMTEPYVLRYTTAPEIGQGKLSGSVAAPKTSRPAASIRTSLRTLADGLKRNGLGRTVFEREGMNAAGPDDSQTVPNRTKAHFGTIGHTTKSTGPFTQILLIDEFSIRANNWSVHAADALIGSSGSYTLDFVRSGSYVPIAVRYTDGTNTEIDALGFHDPDGDGTPNAIEVNEDQHTGIDLQLFDFPRTTARAEPNLSVASDSASVYASDQELRWVQAGYGMKPAGTAYEWTYRFYSPSKNLETEVTVTPLDVIVDTTAAAGVLTEMKPIPDGFIDSDEALQIALDDGGQAFVDSFRTSNVTTILEGGNLYWTDAPIPSEEFWRVRLIGVTSTDIRTFERYINIETGEFLPVEMTRFTASAEGSTVHLQWRTASETNNAGFNVQHAMGDSSSSDWTDLGFVDGTGTTQQPQTYRFQTEPLPPGTHRFRLRQVDIDGTAHLSDVIRVRVRMESPLRLTPPSPHPIRHTATFHVGARAADDATVAVYDMLGRRVTTLYEGSLPDGQLQPVRINADRLPSGVYFVRLTAGDHVRTHKVTVVE